MIDRWAALLEREDYAGAFALTDHIPEMGRTPELVREVIKSHGEADPGRRVTVAGVPTEISRRKSVDRGPTNSRGCFGQIGYDLNIDGKASDLTATFALGWSDGGVTAHLNDRHVMSPRRTRRCGGPRGAGPLISGVRRPGAYPRWCCPVMCSRLSFAARRSVGAT